MFLFSVCLVFLLFYTCWILAFMCERETRSTFSCGYSYSSIISVEYSCLVTIMLLALVFHASLVRAVSSFMLDYSLFSLLNLLESLCSNKFIGVCVGSENVACGS